MKTINKILALVLLLTITVSCNRDQGDTDYLDNRDRLVTFSAGTSGILLVEEDAANTYDIVVGASDIGEAISYTIEIDPSSTAVEGVDFDIVSSTEILNQYIVGPFTIQANFENAAIEGKTVVFNLTDVSNGVIGTQNQFTLTLIKLCPIEAEFTGTYSLSTTGLGIFDTPTFTDGLVTLEIGDTDTERVFSVAPYPAFGVFAPIDFRFSLICNNVVVPSGQVTGVGCGGATTYLGPVDTVGTYDPSDDSVFNIIFADDEDGLSCGVEVVAEVLLTKI